MTTILHCILLLSISTASFAKVSAQVINTTTTTKKPIATVQLGNAVDISQFWSAADFYCIKNRYPNYYQCAFIRVSDPAYNGNFDRNAIKNLHNAYTANIASEVYMSPHSNSNDSMDAQFERIYSTLRSKGIKINRIWLRVLEPENWYENNTENVQAIKSIINKAKTFNVTVGIFTNHNSWTEITTVADLLDNHSNAKEELLSDEVPLWYQRVINNGSSGATQADFGDFRPFGNWKTPVAKQYSINDKDYKCFLDLNRNVFDLSLKVGQNNGKK